MAPTFLYSVYLTLCKGDITLSAAPKGAKRAKKVVSDIPGLVDFAIGLVNSVLNLPDGRINFWGNSRTEEL